MFHVRVDEFGFHVEFPWSTQLLKSLSHDAAEVCVVGGERAGLVVKRDGGRGGGVVDVAEGLFDVFATEE